MCLLTFLPMLHLGISTELELEPGEIDIPLLLGRECHIKLGVDGSNTLDRAGNTVEHNGDCDLGIPVPAEDDCHMTDPIEQNGDCDLGIPVPAEDDCHVTDPIVSQSAAENTSILSHTLHSTSVPSIVLESSLCHTNSTGTGGNSPLTVDIAALEVMVNPDVPIGKELMNSDGEDEVCTPVEECGGEENQQQSTFSFEFKRKVLEYVLLHDRSEAARRFNITARQVYDWYRDRKKIYSACQGKTGDNGKHCRSKKGKMSLEDYGVRKHGRRQTFPLEFKKVVVAYALSHSKREAAKHFELNSKRVYDWICEKEKLLSSIPKEGQLYHSYVRKHDANNKNEEATTYTDNHSNSSSVRDKVIASDGPQSKTKKMSPSERGTTVLHIGDEKIKQALRKDAVSSEDGDSTRRKLKLSINESQQQV